MLMPINARDRLNAVLPDEVLVQVAECLTVEILVKVRKFCLLL
jgi:hypothetical protein